MDKEADGFKKFLIDAEIAKDEKEADEILDSDLYRGLFIKPEGYDDDTLPEDIGHYTVPYSNPRWWFGDNYFPLCFVCSHFYGLVKGKRRCEAFPTGIPDEHFEKDSKILYGDETIPEEYIVCNNGIGFKNDGSMHYKARE